MKIVFFSCCLFASILLVQAHPGYRNLMHAAGVDTKADDSCVGRCGLSGVDTTKPCQCNVACSNFGDCCADFLPTCNTCQNRCNAAYDTKWPCQCNTLCTANSNCCPDYTDLCTGGTTAKPPTTITDAELKELSQNIFLSDVNAVSGIELNLQGKTTSGNTNDLASLPLFTSVPANAFDGPTIKALLALYDNYDVSCSVTEVVTAEERVEDDAFLDAIMATSVMQQAHTFLVSKGLADADPNVFKEFLRTIWMGFYNRGGGTNSACGLEHIFLGEIETNNKIQGFHSWIRFYLDEQAGLVNYLGYIGNVNLGTGGMMDFPVRWRGIYKAITSMSIASSPELDIALATVCFLARPNALCPLQGANGVAYKYQTYEKLQNGVKYVGSAYPTY